VTFLDTNASGAQGSGMIDATGNAEFPAHYYFGAGTHTITASYWGDNSYNSSKSATISFMVQKAGTTTSVTTNSNSISAGSVNVTATIYPTTPTMAEQILDGKVTFTDASSGAVLGTTSIASFVSSSTGFLFGTASLSVPVSQLAVGGNNITASYAGGINFAGSAASNPVAVSCTAGCGNGTGQTLQLSFSGATPSTAISTAGSTSTTSVSVSPGGGFKGAVNLTCAVTGASSGDVNIPKCSFKPGTVTITDTQSVQATLTVTTTAAGTTAAAAAQGGIWSVIRGGTMVACLFFFG
jgi:hypothetical protein